MESSIDAEWARLYEYNPKVQAFAVCNNSTIVWQTSNWDLVSEASALAKAPKSAAPTVQVNGVTYRRVSSSAESYIASADNNQGHFLMALIEGRTWVMAWASSDSEPELAIIDVSKTAIQLMGVV